MNREQKVAIFNKIMNQPVGKDPREVPLELRQLGIRLVFEELVELAKASGCTRTIAELCQKTIDTVLEENGGLEFDKQDRAEDFAALMDDRDINDTDEVDTVEQLDGLCDTAYTTAWCANVFGHGTYFEDAFDEVCRSNDSKACATEELAIATKEHWENPDTKEGGGEHYIDRVLVETSGPGQPVYNYVVKRTSDNKVRKSLEYSPANLKQFLSHLK